MANSSFVGFAFEVDGASVTDFRMPPAEIVEASDVIEDISPDFVSPAINFSGDPFGFQRRDPWGGEANKLSTAHPEVKGVVASPLTTDLASQTEKERDLGVALVEFGGEVTNDGIGARAQHLFSVPIKPAAGHSLLK